MNVFKTATKTEEIFREGFLTPISTVVSAVQVLDYWCRQNLNIELQPVPYISIACALRGGDEYKHLSTWFTHDTVEFIKFHWPDEKGRVITFYDKDGDLIEPETKKANVFFYSMTGITRERDYK